jgi:hypothetical protein
MLYSASCSSHRHHIQNGLINGMHCLPFFVWLVLLMAAAKILFEEQAQNQRWQDN